MRHNLRGKDFHHAACAQSAGAPSYGWSTQHPKWPADHRLAAFIPHV